MFSIKIIEQNIPICETLDGIESQVLPYIAPTVSIVHFKFNSNKLISVSGRILSVYYCCFMYKTPHD